MTTLYEINQNYAEKMAPLTPKELQVSAQNIKSFLIRNVIQKGETYFMFLNNDLHHYTLFKINCSDYDWYANTIISHAQSLGDLKTVNFEGDLDKADSLEFWVGRDMYLFFPYTLGVIEK